MSCGGVLGVPTTLSLALRSTFHPPLAMLCCIKLHIDYVSCVTGFCKAFTCHVGGVFLGSLVSYTGAVGLLGSGQPDIA